MTAQVMVMNSSGIAIASDSAVTGMMSGQPKIFTSADKLFALSNKAPIGILIYNSASITGVPWETVIKVYRSELGDTSFGTVVEYGENFLEWLNNRRSEMFPDDVQDSYADGQITSYFNTLIKDVDEAITEKVAAGIANVDETIICAEAIELHQNLWSSADRLAGVGPAFEKRFAKKYEKTIQTNVERLVVDFNISQASQIAIAETCVLATTRIVTNFDTLSLSGFAIAGFGDDELFPGYIAYQTLGVALNNLLVREDEKVVGAHGNGAIIRGFAQQDMVYEFMTGVSPIYQAGETTYINSAFEELTARLAKELAQGDSSLQTQLASFITAEANAVQKSLGDRLESLKDSYFSAPILEVVGMLPKDELARMAEALVNLTSFRRKISRDGETVGGPIDVVLISKGDGLIWIKRKHYFDPELNPRYFNLRYN